ncbi:MAG TPA: hypothetical protein VEH82_04735 [Acidimicrobiales bacterium]|nr:hypothetical protein [Acidimicrobiales bacterium]
MPSLNEILRRFRFHGVPGAPALVPVPVDRTAELEAELTPVFAALAEVQGVAAATVDTAEREARARRAAAAEEARRIVAEARGRVIAARDEAAAARQAEAEAESRRVLAAGEAEAERVGRLSAARVDALAELVVTRVLALAAAEVPPGQAGP